MKTQEIPASHYEKTGELSRKIEILTLTSEGWKCRYTTMRHKTLKAAKERYCLEYSVNPALVKCQFKP